ncbi:MAG: rod shape-determining protein MreC [Mycobacteriales bacterium]
MRPSPRQRLALALLILVSATLVTLDYQMADGRFVSVLRGAVTSVAGPVQRSVGGIQLPFSGSAAEQDRLRRDNMRLREQLRAAQLDQSAAKQLDRLDTLAARGGYLLVPARVVALGASTGLEWTVTISVGSRGGVRPGMTVITGDGLVGRVKRVSATTCVVLLAIDRLSAVGARVDSSGELGLAKGDGPRRMRLQLLDPQARVSVGDRLVTGPYGETTFAAGVPIGTVSKVSEPGGQLVRTAEVKPYVDFTALDVVGVVLADPGK